MYRTYLSQWEEQVMHYASEHLPAEIRKLAAPEQLILMVRIRADGQLVDAQVVRTSFNRNFDRAIVQLVRDAAPFKPFPPLITEEAICLGIARVFRFDPSTDQAQADSK